MSTVVLDRAEAPPAQANREFISERLWGRLVDRIVREAGVDVDYAGRIMDQTLGFLRLCGVRPNDVYGPSPAVDVGWHTFILYTSEYAEFCARVAGKFIHHWPTDDDESEYGAAVCDVVVAMKQCGIPVDENLWLEGADCTTGHKGSGGDCIRPPGKLGSRT